MRISLFKKLAPSLRGQCSPARSNLTYGNRDCFVGISTLPRLNPPRNDGGALFMLMTFVK